MSSIAVFLVLGGATAFAANQLGKNSVGSKQLKKNAVTAAKLKKNAVTGAKIKPGAVNGTKIDEATLGTVPSATTAGSANVAASLSGYSHNSIRLAPTPVADYTAGVNSPVETTLLSSGPLSVVAKCVTFGGTVYAFTFIKSATEGSAFQGYSDQSYGSNLLGPGTPASERELVYESTSGNYSYYKGNYYGTYAAAAADGTTVNGQVQLGLKTGNLTGTQGLYGPGNVCLFAGTMFTL
jgi:hypothetical protein